MAAKSRRKAREAALRALYEVEVGGSWIESSVADAAVNASLDQSLTTYLEALVWGVQREKEVIDATLAPLLHGYDLSRLAAIDRNVLRIAAYEISFEPSIPPAVTINEAVEIVKKFSTAESGRFVNGVLARYLTGSPKANWDPKVAPSESHEEPNAEEDAQGAPEAVEADSPEAELAKRVGAWRIRES